MNAKEVVINIAALQSEMSSDDPQRIAVAFTLERDGELLDANFRILHRLHHLHRALLHILRVALDSIPPETERITIVSSFSNLIRIGSSGVIFMTHRRFWREVRECLAPYEVVWKLAGEQDERRQALVRCLHALLQDQTLAGPRLATRSRRARKAGSKPLLPNALSADDAICAHNVIDTLKASAA
jgi:hypothetical protein